jgi:prepilin-type N-terminal cleavage/methylation domain-containing protein
MRGRRGFTLVEIVVVIAVVSILASIAAPYAVKLIDQAREEATKQRLQDVYKGIMGDPLLGTTGFLSDMGRIPSGANPLQQLNTQGGQAGPAANPLLGVKIGWHGPYVFSGYDAGAYVNDSFGTAIALNVAGGRFQLRSAGRDRAMNSADDLVYPAAAVNPNGSLLVNLHVWDNVAGQFVLNPRRAAGSYPAMTGFVRLHYSNNGAESTAGAALNVPPATGPNYVFGVLPNGFHAGLHAVEAQMQLSAAHGVVAGQATAWIAPNGQTQVNLYLR